MTMLPDDDPSSRFVDARESARVGEAAEELLGRLASDRELERFDEFLRELHTEKL